MGNNSLLTSILFIFPASIVILRLLTYSGTARASTSVIDGESSEFWQSLPRQAESHQGITPYPQTWEVLKRGKNHSFDWAH